MFLSNQPFLECELVLHLSVVHDDLASVEVCVVLPNLVYLFVELSHALVVHLGQALLKRLQVVLGDLP